MANDEIQSKRGSCPVGQQLQQAREARGFSVAQVADVQHLRPAIINAIENGHYEQIDTELFLKGYIRAYARQVGLDGNALIADLDVELQPVRQKQAQAKAANPLVNMERRRRKKRQTARVVLWLIALAVMGFLIFSFVYNPSQLASLPGASAVSGIGAQSSDDAAADPDASTRSQMPTTNDFSDATPDDERPSEVATMPSTPPRPQGALEDPLEPADNGVAVNPGAEQTSFDADVSASAPALTDNRGRLEIGFQDDCWIQVRDAAGNTLVSGLKRRDDTVDVQADSDIRLIIGAASAISTLRFQGETVDIASKRVVGNRAEFTLTVD